MIEIIPAVLARNTEDLLDKVSQIPEEAGLVHIDILEDDVWTDIGRDFEVHLMVEDPRAIIDKWVERGARRVIVHKIDGVRRGGVELGLGVELHMSLDSVFPQVNEVNFIQLMSIGEIGEQGRPFEPEIFDRIKQVKEKFPDLAISIDGGVSVSNYQELIAAGADRLVVGSGFKELWQKLQTKE